MKWIIQERTNDKNAYNAGSKARIDVDRILISEGYKPLYLDSDTNEYNSLLKKAKAHVSKYKDWKKVIKKLHKGDTLFIQLPAFNHTVFFGRVLKQISKKHVTIIGIIHDLESFRLMLGGNKSFIRKNRLKIEELSALKYVDKLIVHNNRMKRIINKRFKVDSNKLVSLNIFDYLFESQNNNRFDLHKPVVIAGNLDKAKCGYVYNLPEGFECNIYGANYSEEDQKSSSVHYLGKVEPDELPVILDGSFGLVWDGPDSETCSGIYGGYLKLNNPHKTSLYLASGLPIIIWNKAALADFVLKNGVGIAVESIHEAQSVIKSMSDEQYRQMLLNTSKLSEKLCVGFYLKQAIKQK